MSYQHREAVRKLDSARRARRDAIQGDLFSAPYQPHSETSKAAAEMLEPAFLNRLQLQVLFFLRERGEIGATDEEIQRALSMNPSTERPRRVELQRRGLITTTKKRKTSSGRLAAVWSVTQ